jgi:hypothetical protein
MRSIKCSIMKKIVLSASLMWFAVGIFCITASGAPVLNSSATDLTACKTGPSDDNIKEDFTKFWKTFRLAVLNNDTSRLMELILFPAIARSPLDSGHVVPYPDKDLYRAFTDFLSQKTCMKNDTVSITCLDEIARTPMPDKHYIFPTWARVGNLFFVKENGKWYLNLLFLEYPGKKVKNEE